MVSPTPLWQFILGQVIGGALRGMYAAGVILLITIPISRSLVFNGWSFLIMFLNGTVFATIALVLSFLAKSYSDAPRYTAYIIVPMSFLCNTFFSTDQMPMGFRQVIGALRLSSLGHDKAHFGRRTAWNPGICGSSHISCGVCRVIRRLYLQEKEFVESERYRHMSKVSTERNTDCEKKGLMVISFGTSCRESRIKTINAIEKDLRKAFPDRIFCSGWTSHMLTEKVRKNEGSEVMTAEEAVKFMEREGITDLLVQPTHLTEGIENKKA